MASEGDKNGPDCYSGSKPLTPQELDFVRFYTSDPMRNATQAAKKAGYSGSGVGTTARRLLKKPHVAAAIAAAQQAFQARADENLALTLDRVLDEFAKIAFANMGDFLRVGSNGDPYLDLSNLTREQSAVIQEATVEDYTAGRGEDARDVRRVKVKLYDKQKALMAIGTHLGGFVRAKPTEAAKVMDDALMAFLERIQNVERSTIPIAPQRFRVVEGSKE